jgi:phage gpG-like protein
MSSALVQISVDGKDDFKRTFSRLDASFDDLTPIWPAVRDEFWQIESEQFASEGSKGGSGAWKQLSQRYKIRKEKRYPGKKILEASGDLRASLTGNAAGTYYEANDKQIAVGTTIPYARYHHRGEGKLPKREVISFSETQKRRMMKTIQAALIAELRKGNYYVPVSERAF